MEFKHKAGWQIHPLGGETKNAYMGVNRSKKLFLKLNASPFLAALSLEQITPKLLWTRRLSSGDSLTAQEWLEARSLHRDEMKTKPVSDLLYRLHHSKLLYRMLRQVVGQTITPASLLADYQRNLTTNLQTHPVLAACLQWLQLNQPQLPKTKYEVCHGDLNHKNWLVTASGQMYLVDWETVGLADPAFDLSMLMCHYVPQADWAAWLVRYGITVTPDWWARIEWYARINLLRSIKQHYLRGRFSEMNRDIALLAQLMNHKMVKANSPEEG